MLHLPIYMTSLLEYTNTKVESMYYYTIGTFELSTVQHVVAIHSFRSCYANHCPFIPYIDILSNSSSFCALSFQPNPSIWGQNRSSLLSSTSAAHDDHAMLVQECTSALLWYALLRVWCAGVMCCTGVMHCTDVMRCTGTVLTVCAALVTRSTDHAQVRPKGVRSRDGTRRGRQE